MRRGNALRVTGAAPAGFDDRPQLEVVNVKARLCVHLCDDCAWPDQCRSADKCMRGADQGEGVQ